MSSERQLSDGESFKVALSWCKDNKQSIRMISELAEQATKRIALSGFSAAMEYFLETLSKDADTMHFLASNEGARQTQLGIMLATSAIESPEVFRNVCLFLRELSS
jgi:hypothetical protein